MTAGFMPFRLQAGTRVADNLKKEQAASAANSIRKLIAGSRTDGVGKQACAQFPDHVLLTVQAHAAMSTIASRT